MQSNEVLRRHAALVDRMAEARGVDLEESILRGRMDIPDLDDAVLRCTGCANPDNCQVWLDQQQDPATDTPEYCRNSDLFTMLAAE